MIELNTNPQVISEIMTRGVATVLPSAAGLTKLMAERPIKLFLGIDPTGAFLHLGHMVALRKLRQFADAGHQVVLLIGNATVKIGDPTGRDSARPVLTETEIEANFASWKAQAAKVLDFTKIEIVRNGDWLDALKFDDLVKLMAKTTVQQLIERDMFQDRLKNGLPIFGHEILYPLLQGYDSVAMNVDLEIGGTDQTFNMLMGRQLQEVYNHHEKWVLTTPIINGLDGRKMSKSFHNFVALTEPAIDMYAKLMQVADEQIIEYFQLLTDLSLIEISTIEAQIKSGANPMEFKKQLALSITSQLHDPETASEAAEHFKTVIQDRAIPSDLATFSATKPEITVLEAIKLGAPEFSNSEVRRLLDQNSVSLFQSQTDAGTKLLDPNQLLKLTQSVILKVGKKRWFKVIA